MMAATAVYVYGLVKAPRRPAIRGVPEGLPGASAPETLAVAPGLWAIIADVPLETYGPAPLDAHLRDLDWVSRVALAHQAVVGHFSRPRTATILPTKMFTLFSSRERLVADARARRREIGTIARRLAGAEEWGVRITYDRRAGADAAAPVRAASGGAAFLAAKKQARDRQRHGLETALHAAEAGYARLAAIARAASRRDAAPAGASNPPLLDAAFLVPLVRRARFRTAVRAAAAACRQVGATLALTGPWPAYSFAQEPRP